MFRYLDLYAIPITLRFKKEKKFYTNYGALTSMVLIMTMLSFTIKYILEMTSGLNIKQTNSRKLITKKSEELQEQGGSFMFGFQIYDEE